MRLHHAARTHTGLHRKNNEDSLLAVPGVLYAVADGMGGHAAGEVASRVAVDTLKDVYVRATTRGEDPERALERGFVRADANILNDRDIRNDGMGTTLTALAFQGDLAYWGHAGDSRLYAIPWQGPARQMTKDHTMGAAIKDVTGKPSDPAWSHALANCLGGSHGSFTKMDRGSFRIAPGDVYVLATDGLPLEAADLIGQLRRGGPEAIAIALVQAALDRGGHDNVTVVVVKVVP